MILCNYEILRLLKEGGFGRTYEARHIELDEKACLKQNINLTEKDAALLKQEAKLMWKVEHYSLPPIRDFFKAPDSSYVLAMKFIEGRTLEQLIEQHQALEPEEVCWVAQRSLNVLYYLHAKGIVHGDIKPSNLIVKPKTNEVFLLDYGLSTIRPRYNTKAEGYTPCFVAPEVKNGNPPLPESDFYSLGLTLIYAFGGDPLAKSIPAPVPDLLKKFCISLSHPDPMQRLSWEKQDVIAALSDVRQQVFGRRATR